MAAAPDLTVYVLECAHGMYYVGKTHKPVEQRFAEHVYSTKGAEWTSIHRPLRIVQLAPYQAFEEMRTTLEFMKKYGKDNVRGADWCSVELTPAERQEIDRKLSAEEDRCYSCQQTGHMSKWCPNKYRRAGCERCGRTTHTSAKCYASTTASGQPLFDSESSEEEEEVVLLTCFRCGYPGHIVRDCYAGRHISGRYLR